MRGRTPNCASGNGMGMDGEGVGCLSLRRAASIALLSNRPLGARRR